MESLGAATDHSPLSTCLSEPAPREEIEAEPATFSPPASEPRLGEVTLEEATPHSLHLSWMATEGEFDSFKVQYTDEDGQLQEVNVEGNQHDITISNLESDHRYLVSLYGFHDGQPVGPAHIEAMTGEQKSSAHLAVGLPVLALRIWGRAGGGVLEKMQDTGPRQPRCVWKGWFQ